MKNIYFLLFAFLISVNMNAQTASATVQAEIITPISVQLVSGTQLDFGQFIAPTSGSETVTVTSDGTFRTFSDPSMEINSLPDFGVPTFNVTRDESLNYSITTTVDENPTETGGSTMTIDALTVSTGRTGVSGNSFSLGGTLSVSDSNVAGVYTGQVTVTVAYE